MKTTCLDYMACPVTLQSLKMISFVSEKERGVEEIMQGLLTTDRTMYPIIDGIPRFQFGPTFKTKFIHWYHEYRNNIIAYCRNFEKQYENILSGIDKDDSRVSTSFSSQWEKYYYGSKTWGAYPEERANRLLIEFGVTHNDLDGKLLLDTGCGTGDFHAYATRKFNVEIIGIDIADSVDRAFKINKFKPNINYIQGSVITPPIKDKVFDFIYSNGVLHHVPHPYKAFESLARLNKTGGRIYIWLYHKMNSFDKLYYISRVVCHLPTNLQVMVCKSMSHLLRAKQKLVDRIEIMPFEEAMVMYMDALTPVYQSVHTQEELGEWYLNHGYENTTLVKDTFMPKGFGLYAVKG